MKSNLLILMAAFCSLVLSSCDDDNPTPVAGSSSVTINNLPADPPTGYDPSNGAPLGLTDKFSFFRFTDSTVIAHADSATTKWDIGLKGSEIIINSGVSGPGTTGAFIYTGLFGELLEIPADSTFHTDLSGSLAIGKAWSSYDPVGMILNPKPGRVLVIKTSSNHYVKMEILSYYKNAPIAPNAFRDEARYYTFKYTIQRNGTKKFE